MDTEFVELEKYLIGTPHLCSFCDDEETYRDWCDEIISFPQNVLNVIEDHDQSSHKRKASNLEESPKIKKVKCDINYMNEIFSSLSNKKQKRDKTTVVVLNDEDMEEYETSFEEIFGEEGINLKSGKVVNLCGKGKYCHCIILKDQQVKLSVVFAIGESLDVHNKKAHQLLNTLLPEEERKRIGFTEGTIVSGGCIFVLSNSSSLFALNVTDIETFITLE